MKIRFYLIITVEQSLDSYFTASANYSKTNIEDTMQGPQDKIIIDIANVTSVGQ